MLGSVFGISERLYFHCQKCALLFVDQIPHCPGRTSTEDWETLSSGPKSLILGRLQEF